MNLCHEKSIKKMGLRIFPFLKYHLMHYTNLFRGFYYNIPRRREL